MDLKDLLASITDATNAVDAEGRQRAVRDALAGQDLDLSALETAAATRFGELSEPVGEDGYTDDQLAELETLADVVDGLRAESTARESAQQAAEQSAQRAAQLADRVGKPSIPAQRTAPEIEQDSGRQPGRQAGRNGQPEVPDQPVEDAPADDDASGDAGAGAGAGAELVPALAASTGKTVARSAGKNTVPLSSLPKQFPTHQKAGFTLTAAADIPGYPMGSILDGVDGLTQAAMARMQALSRAGKNTTAGIAVLEREQPDQKLIATRPDDYEVVAYACNEKRLPGGSLVASAGWCAPPEQIYDQFCPLPVVDGLISLPTITMRRGSITWPVTPDFSQVYTNTGFYMPIEEMDKAEAPPGDPGTRRDKPCYLVQCTDFQKCVLDVIGLCVKVPILHERAYPELVNYVIQQIMAAHAHKINAVTLRDMEALATTKVTLPAPAVPPALDPYGPGATATLLGIIELQIEYLRYRYRLGMNASMEVVLPAWVKGIVRSDLAKRNGVENMLSVSDEQIRSHMAARGAIVTFVSDWQDAFAGPNQGGMGQPDPNPAPAAGPTKNADMTWLPTWDGTKFGGATPPTTWPQTVTMLIYPAGTYFKGTNDIITIDGLYDSSLLARNLHLALFTEEGFKVCKRGCYEPIAVTVPLCASGQTGSQVGVACPAI